MFILRAYIELPPRSAEPYVIHIKLVKEALIGVSLVCNGYFDYLRGSPQARYERQVSYWAAGATYDCQKRGYGV